MISFEWLHKKISRGASIIAICVAVAVTIVCLEVCLAIYSSKINGDTPEICQLYLEQNDIVHDHFGELQEERFLKDESVTLVQDPNAGTVGLYTFRISGTKAKGTLKMVLGQGSGEWRLDGQRDQYHRRTPTLSPALRTRPERSRASALRSSWRAIGDSPI